MGDLAIAWDGRGSRAITPLKSAGEYALVIALIAFLIAVMAYYNIR